MLDEACYLIYSYSSLNNHYNYGNFDKQPKTVIQVNNAISTRHMSRLSALEMDGRKMQLCLSLT